MSRRILLVAAILALTAGMAIAQPPVGIVIGDPVILRTVPPASTQGVTVGVPTDYYGDPDNGDYDILINGWIEAFAYVSVWDNWISFGIMDPDTGTYAVPYRRWAFSQTGEATYASTGTNWNNMGAPWVAGVEDGGQDPLYAVHQSTLDFDLAGFLVETNARLDLDFNMGALMTRCQTDGSVFNGVDTRRVDGGFYQLANQYKMVFKGKFLEYDSPGFGDPAQDAAGTAYVAPTSTDTTAYNFWTDWDSLATPGIIPNNNGWLWPCSAGGGTDNDPWTGAANLTNVLTQTGDPGNTLEFLTLVVERGQAQGTPGSLSAPPGNDGPAEAAEVWFAERIWRRGLQDAAGNYRADRLINLIYREADVLCNP